jgi:serine/threonine-protein kinase
VTNNVLSREIPAAIDLERLLREIEVAAKPTHPDLLPVQGCGTAEGLLFYVKPCVTAESLRDRVNREMQLPLEDALRFDRGWPPGGTTTPVG